MRQVLTFAVLSVLASSPAMAQGGAGAGAGTAAGPSSGASRLSPEVGAGQSPSQAVHDPNRTRQSLNAKPSKNPNGAGNAASDGTAGTSSPRSPQPKPGG